MKNIKVFFNIFILVFLAPGLAVAEEPIELPPIQVVAPTTDGGSILCQGAGCWSVLMSLQGSYVMFDNFTDFIGKIDPAEVDRSIFCSNLKKKQPSKCRLGSIPSTPVYDPGWQPNGCGTGAIANAAVSKLLAAMFDGFYTLDEPYRGVSFESACNSHDRCFSSGDGFDNCNNRFSGALSSACSGGTVSGTAARYACENYAAAYRAAVSTDQFGATAYAEAQADLTCAGWYKAMKMNRCM